MKGTDGSRGRSRSRVDRRSEQENKNGDSSFDERKRGVSEEEAKNSACTQKGPWRSSKTIAMHIAYPNSYFEELGLVSLLKERLSL